MSRRNNAIRPKQSRRRGAIALMIAVCLLALLAFGALAVDIGFIATSDAELRSSLDAAALAGAGGLIDGRETAIREANEAITRNPVAGRALLDSEVKIELGEWDRLNRQFTPGSVYQPYAVRVSGQRREAPLFFARALGYGQYDVSEEAVATFLPRDIMVVLDYSGSMNDDSELRNIRKLGRTQIEQGLLNIYQDLGSPKYGKLTWTPKYLSTTSDSKLLKSLGLNGVKYPYPRGSWKEYFDYVQRDYDCYRAGYRRRYGYLTLVNYWLDWRPKYNETPDLWKTREQPITAVKNAVSLFLDFLRSPDMEDRVGLTIYTSSNGTALVEQGLTRDFDAVDTISRKRQAAHYDAYTNIGDGIRIGADELASSARTGAFKLLILMTDGQANRPSGIDAGHYAELQARIAAEQGIRILTISFGANSDSKLMEDIASIGSGVHFSVPGGGTISQYEQELIGVFQEIARHRPLKLVR